IQVNWGPQYSNALPGQTTGAQLKWL
ncbi:MAG: hypothetical protein ACI8RD_011090, partial [Bacillariaceae sp.]